MLGPVAVHSQHVPPPGGGDMLSIGTIFPFPLKRHRLSRQTHNDLVFQVVDVISPRHLYVPGVVPSAVQTVESLLHFSLSLYFSKIMRDYYV